MKVEILVDNYASGKRDSYLDRLSERTEELVGQIQQQIDR